MKVLFIVTSYWAYGELLIALHFARRLCQAGGKPLFFISSAHAEIVGQYGFPYTLMIPHSRKINRLLMQDLEICHHPLFIVLADFLNYCFCERHYGLLVEDLDIFSGRLGTFDNFDWELTGKQMDTYGYKASRFGEINIEQFGFRLMPCPIVHPARGDPNAGRYTYPLQSEILSYDESKTAAQRKELGLPANRQLILITSALWQETYKLYPHVVQFVEAANQTFKSLLLRLAEHYTILYVGPEGFLQKESLPPSFVFRPQLLPDVFDQHVLASDLYLSRNITSTTLARIALSGVPSVVIKNSLFFNRETRADKFPFCATSQVQETLSALEFCYPFRMFPVGWFKFLKPIVTKNPYLKLLVETEQFDEEGSVEKINDILENRATRERLSAGRQLYHSLLENLPSVAEILQ